MNPTIHSDALRALLTPHATATPAARARGRVSAALVAFVSLAALAACTEQTTSDSNGATRGDAGALFDVNPDASAAATASMCAAVTACGACTDLGPCGWCTRTNSCLSGNAGGSDDGTCTDTDWDFFGDTCSGTPPPDPCAGATACGACTLRDSCGWCASSSRCLQGDETGSTDGTCTGSGWDFLGDHCAPGTPPPPDAGSSGGVDASSGGDPCAAASTCGACTAMGSCGWCVGRSRCASGTSTGSTDGACTGSGWDWTGTSCGG